MDDNIMSLCDKVELVSLHYPQTATCPILFHLIWVIIKVITINREFRYNFVGIVGVMVSQKYYKNKIFQFFILKLMLKPFINE